LDCFLVDSRFKMQWRPLVGLVKGREITVKETKGRPHHCFTVSNAERSFKLASESYTKMLQFVDSIQEMVDLSPWSRNNRFDSFAPVRSNVALKWLVDGVCV
jgi:phospholipase D1/2